MFFVHTLEIFIDVLVFFFVLFVSLGRPSFFANQGTPEYLGTVLRNAGVWCVESQGLLLPRHGKWWAAQVVRRSTRVGWWEQNANIHINKYLSRRWVRIFLIFNPQTGEDSQFDSYSSMGWNHQPDIIEYQNHIIRSYYDSYYYYYDYYDIWLI